MFKKVPNSYISNDDIVNVKIINNDVILTKVYFQNTKCRIKNISKKEYEDVATGEVKEKKLNKTGSINITSAKKSSKKLRELINNNVDTSGRCLLLTLTYEDEKKSINSMKDGGYLLKYKLKTPKAKKLFKYNSYEYIMINEPQGNGLNHLHIFLITDSTRVFINEKKLAKIWGKGFVFVEKIKDGVTNLGYYYDYIFNAMTLKEIKDNNIDIDLIDNKPETKKWIGPRGGKHSKRFVKGARMLLMKEYTRHYSYSKGIKTPEEIKNIKSAVAKEIFLDNPDKKPDETVAYLIGDIKYDSFNKITKNIYKNSYKNTDEFDDYA